MKQTTNFKLNKPDNIDTVDITKLNENMDILDDTLLNNKTDILTLNTTVGSVAMTTTAQNVKGAINELDADVASLGTQINNLATNKADLVNGKIPSIQLPNIEVPVQSVNSKTGTVVLTKTDIGLGNVDNSADSAKAVLSATKLATQRTINGVAFDGTVNITVADGTKAPTNHASANSTYGLGTPSYFGHVAVRNDLSASTYADGQALSAYQGKVLDNKIAELPDSLIDNLEVSFLHKFQPLSHFTSGLQFGSAFYSLATIIRVEGSLTTSAYIRTITINIPNVPYVQVGSYNDHTNSGSTNFVFNLWFKRTSDNADVFTMPLGQFKTYESGGANSVVYFVPKIYRGTTQTVNIYAENYGSIMARIFDHSAFTISPAVIINGLY